MFHRHHAPHGSRGYVPAAGFDLLTPLYDPLIRVLVRERTIKQRLLDHAAIQAGHSVLDVGCGTGTLAIMAKRACPGARVVGLDGDPRVLEIARRKITRAGLDVELVEGLANDPPLPAASFDRVLSSLMLHHLTREEKRAAFAAIHGLLRPGGELHIVDFGPPAGSYAWAISHLFRHFDGAERTSDNLDGRLPALLIEAGFTAVRERGRAATAFGTLIYWSASSPRRR